MNYRHIYHAGNFADVFKHIMLVGLITALKQKPKPFAILDTHAGLGLYDLQSPLAAKTGEFVSGIQAFMSALKLLRTAIPEWASLYSEIVTGCQPKDIHQVQFYPGSPCIAHALLRASDRLILSELKSEDYQILKHSFARQPQVAVHHQDGYQSLKAFLPFTERRGLVLIDPPFEQKDEWQTLSDHLITAVQKWPTGIYAIWYPHKDWLICEQFLKTLQKKLSLSTLQLNFRMPALQENNKLTECGLLVVNPPWQWSEQANMTLQWLCRDIFSREQASGEMQWLVEAN